MKPCRTYYLGCLVMAVWFCLADTATAQNFTLEQVMSSPFPSEPTVLKRGDKIAWVLDAEGKRNLWIAEAPTFAAHQLTHYDNDDGQELSEPGFFSECDLDRLRAWWRHQDWLRAYHAGAEFFDKHLK